MSTEICFNSPEFIMVELPGLGGNGATFYFGPDISIKEKVSKYFKGDRAEWNTGSEKMKRILLMIWKNQQKFLQVAAMKRVLVCEKSSSLDPLTHI